VNDLLQCGATLSEIQDISNAECAKATEVMLEGISPNKRQEVAWRNALELFECMDGQTSQWMPDRAVVLEPISRICTLMRADTGKITTLATVLDFYDDAEASRSEFSEIDALLLSNKKGIQLRAWSQKCYQARGQEEGVQDQCDVALGNLQVLVDDTTNRSSLDELGEVLSAAARACEVFDGLHRDSKKILRKEEWKTMVEKKGVLVDTLSEKCKDILGEGMRMEVAKFLRAIKNEGLVEYITADDKLIKGLFNFDTFRAATSYKAISSATLWSHSPSKSLRVMHEKIEAYSESLFQTASSQLQTIPALAGCAPRLKTYVCIYTYFYTYI